MSASTFLFATGIENSYPTINSGRTRIDEMEKCGHYTLWKTDFDLLDDVGIRVLRYGPPIHTTWLGQGRYDWDFCDQTFGELYRRNVVPIVDLCHFGVPDWIGNFQNPDFPELFAGYAQAFAERFPWVQLYTPVNEMFVCAAFSAAYGWWNEQLCERPGLRHGPEAHRQGQRAGHGDDPRRPRRCHLHPERVLGALPPRLPECDPARRVLQRPPLSSARSQLRPAGGLRTCSSISWTTA